MADPMVTQEMKKHTIIVDIKAEHCNLERFLKVVRSFVYKVHKELGAKDGNVWPVNILDSLTLLEHLNLFGNYRRPLMVIPEDL
ncbi:UNVERIFIED_CONTAM: hypothetical protein RMT77_010175 [Armadillidium vulgare]